MELQRILLVEDNPGDARLLREMFNELDARHVELVVADRAKEAERLLAEQGFELILLDLGLPDATGMMTLRRMRMVAPHVPLVVLTGLDDDDLALSALEEGAQDYLVKGQISARGLSRSLLYASERKRVERARNEFISVVSHELRTPLTSIHGSLGLVVGQAAGKLPDAAEKLVVLAHRNSSRLVLLVNDILDVAKLESGKAVFNFDKIEARSLVEQAIETTQGFADKYDVRVRLEDNNAFGHIWVDPIRLTQVVTNLLSNAIKFSPAGGEVLVAVETEVQSMSISVRDHGPGIPVEFRAQIFQKFMQANHAATGRTAGTGLGLNIVKQIVDRLDGKIGFADAPGGGTVFTVELPCWENTAKYKSAS